MFALVDAGRKTEPKAPNVEGESWQDETSKPWKTLGVVCREMLDGLPAGLAELCLDTRERCNFWLAYPLQ